MSELTDQLAQLQQEEKAKSAIHRQINKSVDTRHHDVQKPHSVKELLQDRKKTEWVIDQIGAKGNLVLLAGESGCGKTSLMYSMASAISKGEKFLDTFPAVKKKVLFIQADESKNNCSEKCHTMGISDEIDFVFAEDGWENLFIEDIDRLEKQIGDKYGAVFLDSITTLCTGGKYSFKDGEFAAPLYALNNLASRKSLLVVMSSHLKKPKEGERRQVTKHDVMGNQSVYSAASDVWTIHKSPRAEFSDHFLFECLGKRNCEDGLLYNLQGDQETFSWYLKSAGAGQLTPYEENQCSTQILELFYNGGNNLSAQEISIRTGFNDQHTRRVLRKLHSLNLLARDSRSNPSGGRPTHIYINPS